MALREYEAGRGNPLTQPAQFAAFGFLPGPLFLPDPHGTSSGPQPARKKASFGQCR
jgi:hypothetical protein